MPQLRRKPQITRILAASILVAHATPSSLHAQEATPAAPVVVSVATLNRLFNEAEAAFTAKDYNAAVSRIQELLKTLGPGKEAPYELLYFNIGLAHLLADHHAEAEAAFRDCYKRYPKGEYASRCLLGIGRSCMLQDTPEKNNLAIQALRGAAADPKFRSEAGLWLGEVLIKLNKREDALKVFKSLMGSDIRTPQQTSAAVQVIGLLADSSDLSDLIAYLNRLSSQEGVRDSMAWYVNQVIVRGDELVGGRAFPAALALYRSIPPRTEIISTQSSSLEGLRKQRKLLEAKIEQEKNKPINQRSSAAELLGPLKSAIEQAETALKTIEEKKDLDAAILMRRGRCLFYMERLQEALFCFGTIREKFSDATDAQSAAYAEIVIINKNKDIPAIKERCEAFMRKYPDSPNMEQVATLAGEVLVQSGNWKEVGAFYKNLETKFPQSESLDRYVFFQGLAFFQDANFAESGPIFAKFLKSFPSSPLVENALYYVAMSNFLSNKYKETLAACREYLSKFPDGRYAGDMRYRLSFIDFNDKEQDQTEKIIRELGAFLQEHPDDLSNGSMLCLMADCYKKRVAKNDAEATANEDKAIECYRKAAWTDSPDDAIQYALESATNLLQARKDWAAVADLHAAFLKHKPDSNLALVSATWVAKMKARDGKGEEAAQLLADSLNTRIGDPSGEQVEFLIDELVKTLVPRKKPKDIDTEAIDKQLTAILEKVVAGNENATTAARIYYARARLAQLLRRNDRSDLYLKGIATTNSKDPSGLSPALLSVCGDILLKTGDLDGAETMFSRLKDKYQDSMFSDAGPVGLGFVKLARKEYPEALSIFENALETNPGMSKFKEATLGKLSALAALERNEPAIKLALEMVGDKTFRGETAAKAYMILGQIHEKIGSKSATDPAENLKKAHGYYQRLYVAYQGFPELCGEAYWRAYETAKTLGDATLAENTLKVLADHPKLQNTEWAKKAKETTP